MVCREEVTCGRIRRKTKWGRGRKNIIGRGKSTNKGVEKKAHGHFGKKTSGVG